MFPVKKGSLNYAIINVHSTNFLTGFIFSFRKIRPYGLIFYIIIALSVYFVYRK